MDDKRGIETRDTYAGKDAVEPVQHMLLDGHCIDGPIIVCLCTGS
jgi:hypothetical protein